MIPQKKESRKKKKKKWGDKQLRSLSPIMFLPSSLTSILGKCWNRERIATPRQSPSNLVR